MMVFQEQRTVEAEVPPSHLLIMRFVVLYLEKLRCTAVHSVHGIFIVFVAFQSDVNWGHIQTIDLLAITVD